MCLFCFYVMEEILHYRYDDIFIYMCHSPLESWNLIWMKVNIDISHFQYLTLFVSNDGHAQICPTTRFSVFEEAHVVDRSGRRNKMEKRRLHMQAPLSSFVVQGKIFRNEAWRSGSTQKAASEQKDSIISRFRPVYVINKIYSFKYKYVSFVQTVSRLVKCFWFNQMLQAWSRECWSVEVWDHQIVNHLRVVFGSNYKYT